MRIAIGTLVAVCALGCSSGDVSRDLGARCAVTDDCADRCLPPDGDHPGGFCTLDCSSDADCPNDARCVDEQGGVCLFSCRADPDCDFLGAGWLCRDRDARDGGGQVKVCRGD